MSHRLSVPPDNPPQANAAPSRSGRFGRPLRFILNKRKFDEDVAAEHVFEIEVIAEARVRAEYREGPYCLSVWDKEPMESGTKRKLCLRVRERLSSVSKVWAGVKYDPKEAIAIADEIVVLASLFLRTRLWRGRIVRVDDVAEIVPEAKCGRLDEALVVDEGNLACLSEYMDRVEKLDGKSQAQFMLAAKMYHEALMVLESRPDMAYLNLVSAIEALAGDFADFEKPSLSEFDPKLAKHVCEVAGGNEVLRGQIEQCVLQKERFISRRIVAFILAHTGDAFWKTPESSDHGRVKPRSFEELLKRVYNRRSALLHDGTPFPDCVFRPPDNSAALEFRLREKTGEDPAASADFLPSVAFFERLVNSVLKSYLDSRSRNPGA